MPLHFQAWAWCCNLVARPHLVFCISIPIRPEVQPQLAPALKIRTAQGRIIYPLPVDAGLAGSFGVDHIFWQRKRRLAGIGSRGITPIPIVAEDFSALGGSFILPGTIFDLVGVLDSTGRTNENLLVPASVSPIRWSFLKFRSDKPREVLAILYQ